MSTKPGQRQILNYLESHGIQPVLSLDSELETGEVILVYFADTIRMAIASEGANSNIKVADCSKEKIIRLNPDVLIIDGYIMSHEEGKSIVVHLIRLAQVFTLPLYIGFAST